MILTGSAPFFNVSVKCPRLRFNQGPSPSSPSVAVCLEPRPPRPAPWDPAHSPLTGGLPATAVLLSPVTVTSVLGFVLGEGSGETWTRRGRGAACPALSPGWKSFKTTPFLRASGQSISWPCQPPGCRSGHFPGQSHCHSSAWVAVPPTPRHPHLLSRLPSPPLPRRPALPCRGGPLRAPLTVPGASRHTALGPVQWCRDQDRPPWAGRAGEAAGTPHRHPCRRPGRRLPGCACPRVWPRRPRPGSGEPRAGPRRGAFGTHGMERERRGRVGVACVLENGTVCSPPVPRCPAAAWPASSWFPARPAPDRLCPLQALSPLLSRFRSWAHGGAGRTGTGPGRCHRVFP